ncbi:hypothetical protein ASPVEDRAFT_41909 [Aspergillus versicolor CBS 583.65]|uniref:DUF7492 domain-containing protein n=1 Tax=Aspergillus versicolor CBS 583.65 TaxID=1036611 RepID=A0A1L9PLK6_ASPVE|nr:uncharacterized protein ASPVEDRAFT_41909 [Aspergillus versicolor CBS 583.65]OJJ02417.1 hypothetical protein ASPVEDRAFT_41909 [Aspergillus versicolor CBS 583.65]
MDSTRRIGQRLILLALLFTSVCAHSWVEQLMVIASNGTFIGSPGYPRGYVSRSDGSFNDGSMTYILPRGGEANVTKSDSLCSETQRKQDQTDGYPRLQASAGAAVALRFQENGHVTLPDTQLGKPKNRGTVYVYGTADPKQDEKLLDVQNVWTADGTGGDGRGVLLGTRNYDDGRCYQVNGGEISTTRQKDYPHDADQDMGGDLWCQADIKIPSSAPSGTPYTLYWVWDWPTAAGVDPGLPDGKQEMYTTCMDVDVGKTDNTLSRTAQDVNYDHDQSLNAAAIPEQFNEIFNSESGEPTGGTSTSQSVVASSNTTAAPSGSSTVPPLATVTVTSFVTSVQYVQPTGSA